MAASNVTLQNITQGLEDCKYLIVHLQETHTAYSADQEDIMFFVTPVDSDARLTWEEFLHMMTELFGIPDDHTEAHEGGYDIVYIQRNVPASIRDFREIEFADGTKLVYPISGVSDDIELVRVITIRLNPYVPVNPHLPGDHGVW